MDHPLGLPEAQRIVRHVLDEGVVSFSKHGLTQMRSRQLETMDCVNVLKRGSVKPPELIDGTWRYKIETSRIAVVVVIESETKVRVVTAWRY